MMIATMLSKVAGLLRDVFIAAKFGTESIEATAYSYASSLPVQLFDFTLGAAVLATFIPIFNGYLESGDKKRALEFSNNFINITVLISTVISVLCMLLSKYIGVLIAPDLDAQTQLLLQKLVIIVLPTTIFTTLAYAFVGILQSLGEFNVPAIISLVSNVVIILYLLLFDSVYGLCIAMLVGWGLQFVVQIPSLIKKGYKYRFTFNFKDKGIREAVVLALPVLVSSWLQPISVFVNKRYASSITGGGPALDYANRFYIIVVGVFVLAITNYIFPAMSKKTGSDDKEGFSEIVTQAIRAMFLIIAPIMVGMALISDDVISLVYGRGQFTENSVRLTSEALRFYTFGMIAYGINEILNKCFYAMKKPKIPMAASVAGIAVTIVVSSLSAKVWNLGVGGLAMSSSVAALTVAVILVVILQKKIPFVNTELFVHILKICISAAVMAAAVMAAGRIVCNMPLLLRLAAEVLTGAAVYAVMLLLLRVREVREVLKC